MTFFNILKYVVSCFTQTKLGGILMKDIHKWASGKFGIGFWIGGGVYSLINLIMNLSNIPQNKVLTYDLIITGVAVVGLILNIILLKKKRELKEDGDSSQD